MELKQVKKMFGSTSIIISSKVIVIVVVLPVAVVDTVVVAAVGLEFLDQMIIDGQPGLS